MSDDTTNELLDVFIFETEQFIEQLEESILFNEEDCYYSEESINEIFRIMHTIKGSSAMMMFSNISTLAHAMEDLFCYLRDEKPENVDFSILTDLVLECIDFIKTEIEKIKNGNTPDGENAELNKKIDNFLNCLKKGETAINIFKLVFYFENGCEMEDIRAFTIIRRIQNLADEVHYLPENIDAGDNCEQRIEVIRSNGFIIYIKTTASYEDIEDFINKTEYIRDYYIAKLDSDDEIRDLFYIADVNSSESIEKKELVIKETVKANKEETNTTVSQSIISVGVGKLDKLMDLMGELVIAEAMVIQNSDLKGLVLDNFYKSARQLNKITDEMQDMVMAIRMVPLSATFHKMHRLVRDMSKKLEKDVNLEIIGEETEVDKNIIEHISDPLMHLVRNAVDHGIETPQEREEAGKDKAGTLTLEAKNAGGDVLIIIKDDGSGLDRNKILEKAKEKGLLNKPEEDMTEKEINNLICLPGFSTNREVSEFSGRGVGMDVVTKNIEMVGGSVSMDSILNKGTTITLKIPLTLAIIDGMNIKVGRSHYTIPTISVKEFFRPKREDIITDPDNNEMIMVRGLCYPILRLYQFYGVANAKTDFEDGIIIMVEQDEQMICVFADELLGQQQVVVKALPKYILNFKKIKGLTGCTLLGDGNISLILDIAGLILN